MSNLTPDTPKKRSVSPFLNQDVSQRKEDHNSSVALDDYDFRGDGDSKARRSRLKSFSPRTNRRVSFVVEAQEPTPEPPALEAVQQKTGPVAWKDLPEKRQLAILTIARLAEPLTQTSLQAYMFYQLRSFDPSLPDSTIAQQAGYLQCAWTISQFITGMMWGYVSDRWGRKICLLIGLAGTCIYCLGFGFARSFAQAFAFRFLGGCLNGNVGVMRTMISEIVQEKKYQSRAFLLLPMCFNIGIIVGPVLGGLLADPIATYPWLVGPGSFLGGESGIRWMIKFPYALPNLVSAAFLIAAMISVFLQLKETLDTKRNEPDLGIAIGKVLGRYVRKILGRQTHGYSLVGEEHETDNLLSPDMPHGFSETSPKKPPKVKRRLPFSRIFTRNVCFTVASQCILGLHVATYQGLSYVFFSTPRFDPKNNPKGLVQHLPFMFTGGLGMPPAQVGMAMSILGTLGITMQLLVYPKLQGRLGVVRSYRIFLTCFPIAYAAAPFLSLVPSTRAPPSPSSGPLIWLSLATVMFVQVLARTFALPAAIILINNSSPHPSVLGQVHGIAQSMSSLTRAIGPLAGTFIYGYGLDHGMVGLIYWILASIAICGCIWSYWLREGTGHEILLEGEEEEMEERADRK